jgi:hypothetical protein
MFNVYKNQQSRHDLFLNYTFIGRTWLYLNQRLVINLWWGSMTFLVSQFSIDATQKNIRTSI